MKDLKSELRHKIPEGGKVTIKSKKGTVTGPHGTLKRDLSHIHADMRVEGDEVVVSIWFSTMKYKACLRSCMSAITNMIVGVTEKYHKTMRLVYAHFPINFTITDGGKKVEIRNFLGEKVVRRITMLGDTVVSKSADVKDQIEIEGTDVDLVGRSAALINQSCLVKNKDIRKFLDGIYVSARGVKGRQTSI